MLRFSLLDLNKVLAPGTRLCPVLQGIRRFGKYWLASRSPHHLIKVFISSTLPNVKTSIALKVIRPEDGSYKAY
jgi:hypothetical protein